MHVVGDHPRHTDAAREGNELAHQCVFLGQAVIPDFDREGIVEEITQCAGNALGLGHIAGRQRLRYGAAGTAAQCEEAVGVLRQQCERHRWCAAFRHIHARTGDECADVAVADA